MKLIKLFTLTLCAASLLLAGCKTCCQEKDATAKTSCGMQCCLDAKASCGTCPKCSAK